MASIRVAIDKIQSESADIKTLKTFAQKLRDAGHTVTTHGRGPNKIQSVMKNSSNKCDIMIQVAGGRCIGTLCDFYLNLKSGYYHAQKGGFAYFKRWDDNWKVRRADDDDFSTHSGTAIYREVNSKLGKTLPEVYAGYSNMFYGHGNTAEECAKTFLANMGCNTTTNTNTNAGSSSILDALKQVLSDLDSYGIDFYMRGDEVIIKKTNPNNATVLDTSQINRSSIAISNYDSDTPNSIGNIQDEYLIQRFGKIPLDNSIEQSNTALLMAQRGHNHKIELKCILNNNYLAGNWVSLTIPEIGIVNRLYYITKNSFSEKMLMGVTLEPGPPSRYVEVQEVQETNSDSSVGEE